MGKLVSLRRRDQWQKKNVFFSMIFMGMNTYPSSEEASSYKISDPRIGTTELRTMDNEDDTARPSPPSGKENQKNSPAQRPWVADPTPLAPGLYIVATPIGNLEDITLRALRVLANAAVIYCEDTRHSARLLGHYGLSTPTLSYHEHNAERQRSEILRRLGEGQAVALISDAGTPLLSDPGFKLVRAALAAGHAVHPIPGPSAVTAALSVAGLPTNRFFFAGFLPNKAKARQKVLTELTDIPATLVFFEAPKRLGALLSDMAALWPERDAVVARELTKRYESLQRGTVADLAAQYGQQETVRGECVILVAPPIVETPSEAAIREALTAAPKDMSRRDKVRWVAEKLGVPRRHVYDLALKQGTREKS